MDNLLTKFVKTRKPHPCLGCCRVIPSGEKAEKCVTADDGTVHSTYLCSTCFDKTNKNCSIYAFWGSDHNGYFPGFMNEIEERYSNGLVDARGLSWKD